MLEETVSKGGIDSWHSKRKEVLLKRLDQQLD